MTAILIDSKDDNYFMKLFKKHTDNCTGINLRREDFGNFYISTFSVFFFISFFINIFSFWIYII